MTSRTHVLRLLLAAAALWLLAATSALPAATPAAASLGAAQADAAKGTTDTTGRVWEHFSANFVEGLTGRTGGLLASQVGQQVGDGIARLAQPGASGILSSGLGAILGPAIGQFVATAAFQLGTRWAVNRYRESTGSGEVKAIDLQEVLVASLGSAVGGAVLSAVLGPTVGRFVGGFLGYNLALKLLDRAREGHGFDLAGALKTVDYPSVGLSMAALGGAKALTSWLVPSPLLASPVGLMVTVLLSSVAATLSMAISETAKEAPAGSGGLEQLREALAAAYERYLTLQRTRSASDPELNWAFIDYHRARSAYNEAIATSVSTR
jgi:hypothetical protein